VARTIEIATAFDLELCFTPVESPERATISPRRSRISSDAAMSASTPEIAAAVAAVADQMDDYDEAYPPAGLVYCSPRERVRTGSQRAARTVGMKAVHFPRGLQCPVYRRRALHRLARIVHHQARTPRNPTTPALSTFVTEPASEIPMEAKSGYFSSFRRFRRPFVHNAD
jgi:hypothetical protein